MPSTVIVRFETNQCLELNDSTLYLQGDNQKCIENFSLVINLQKKLNQLLLFMNRHMAFKPQSRNLIRKNINNFAATDFKENSCIGGILKADLHTWTFLIFIYGLLNNLIRGHFVEFANSTSNRKTTFFKFFIYCWIMFR